MEKRFKIIETPDYYLAVSDEDKKRGYFYCYRTKQIFQDEGCDIHCCNSDVVIEAYQPKGDALELDLPLLPEIVVEDDVENLAELKYPEYPNNPRDKPDWHYNRDINCFRKRKAFINGYKAATKKFSEEDLRNIIKWLNKNYSKVEDELARPFEDNQSEFSDTFFIDAYEEALTRAIDSIRQPKTPMWFVFETESIVIGHTGTHNIFGEKLKTTIIGGKECLVGKYLNNIK